MDVIKRNAINAVIGLVGNLASRGVSVWVDDTVPLLLERVEDITKSCGFVIRVARLIAIKDTVAVLNITSGVDVKFDFAVCRRPNGTRVGDVSSDG